MKRCAWVPLRRDAAWLPIVGWIAALFGVATIVAASRVLFFAMSGSTGVVVPFVVWFNLGAGFLYVLAGFALARRCGPGLVLALAIAGATALVTGALAIHATLGGAFATRTAFALGGRTLFWLGVAALVHDRRATSETQVG